MNQDRMKWKSDLYEFHVSRRARDFYQFDQQLFTTNGNLIFADFRAARSFAQKMNEKRDLATYPERTVRAGQINAMGLIDEILHEVIEEYRKQVNPGAIQYALEWINGRLGVTAVDEALLEFARQFPPMDVFRGLTSAEDYLEGYALREDGRRIPHRELLLEELLMLWLANENPAFGPMIELFDDSELDQSTVYKQIVPELHSFFETQPKFGPESENLIDLLQKPAKVHPYSLSDQLDFMRRRWSDLISLIIIRLLSSLDMIREEEKPVFGFGGEPQTWVYEYRGPEYEIEPERFSQDVFWMPNLVLLAKNSYVWLDQLSRKYKRAINHLDQVPEEELEMIARWGFTGLWLIGLWERSRASQQIKQMRGNADAVASAYSLFSYEIATDLGGEEAYQILREKASKYGIRLASDMVPNHMGIDSRWVIEHPDWFIQLNYPPYPAYSFNGTNLSWDERVGIFIEDHYYDNSDAAVVFKRVDFWTGDARYIYHGNDGTSMPWNDTAQLNYLMPEVREAVIQTILHVARKFPIIRFDAAMTLAKRHFQRLWFPEPGSGGDIPSRAEHGMTKPQFDEAFPEEFWRMVVDRVAAEAPDTLLLAEAFWLMEGYFVRTLGMHRVYNSAFMNMLRDEKNQEYRLVIKNTVEFDPEILKRFVNFMNNPDERTAVDQFGKGDKYFGICTVMATMPGLPMFGHGQIEGFEEKYGMEYRYPRWHEQPDPYLVERHSKEVFPLLRKRYLFAEASNFRLYDFYTPEGFVNEDVYAYSNQAGDQRGLVVFHNRFADVRGWVHLSAAYPVKTGQGDEKVLVQSTLSEAFGLHDDPEYFTIFREHISGLEYIRSSQMLCQQGMYLDLHAYHCAVFLDFREIQDDANHRYAELHAALNGKGAASIQEALLEYELRELLFPYRELVNPGMLNWLIQNRVDAEDFEPLNYQAAMAEVGQKLLNLLKAAGEHADEKLQTDELVLKIRREIEALLMMDQFVKGATLKEGSSLEAAIEMLQSGTEDLASLETGDPAFWVTMLCCLITGRLGELGGQTDYQERSRKWIDDWLLAKVMAEALKGSGLDEQTAGRNIDLVRILTTNQGWLKEKKESADAAVELLSSWLRDEAGRRFLKIHPYQEILWFNREAFEELVWWTFALEFLQQKAEPSLTPAKFSKNMKNALAVVQELRKAEQKSGYQVEKLI